MVRTLAGIVLYNPDIGRLIENYNAIVNQVDDVLIIDNGSDNYNDIDNYFNDKKVQIIRNYNNLGIATALSQIMEYASSNEFDWVLTLDQDSVCRDGIIEKYKEYLDLENAGILTCKIIDRNFKETNRIHNGSNQEINQCITSGSFMNTKAYNYCDGFDKKMFIDGVDFDICLNLRSHGYKIYRIDFVGLLHEVGHGKNVKLLFKDYIIYNHSPLRNYYMARNTFYLVNKYPEYMSLRKEILREIRAEVLIIIYEKNKVKKIMERWKGIHDLKNM